MKTATKAYASSITLLASFGALALYGWRPAVSSADVSAVLFLCALAVAAEMLAFVLTNANARGSVAFIPYLAMVLVVPSWVAIAAVSGVKLVTEAFKKRGKVKALFNTSAHALSLTVAIAVYLALGGESLLEAKQLELSTISSKYAWQALAAYSASFVVNIVAVSAVIALESNERLSTVLGEVSLSTVGADLLATPIVFIFSWVYAGFGPIAAAAAWVPIVGIRHVNRVNLELERTNQELLQLMVKSIEARDPYTSGHSRRVSKYAVAIARSLQLSEREVKRIATAALLHDVGKIYEKYAPILRNPGKLTPDEWVTMQEHPIDGASLIATISRMKELVPAVRHHHENWDGSGYPDKLRGDAIPLASRIIMFADTIDAMTSERPYRGPLGEAEVRAEILRGRGKQFDPSLTDRLLAIGVWRTVFGETRAVRPREKLALIQETRSAV